MTFPLKRRPVSGLSASLIDATLSLSGLLLLAVLSTAASAAPFAYFTDKDPVESLQVAVPPAAADDMAMTALTLMGTPYKFGGTSPEGGFDCSGLVQYIYRDISTVTLPRTAAEMANLAGRDVTTRELVVGDLLFFRLGSSSRINHVGVYIGKDRFVHAPRTGTNVRIDKLDNRYWMRYYDKARRLFTDEGNLHSAVSMDTQERVQ
ncbi:MAG: C40 family peptidase [Pseudomonadota bacterium]